MYKLISTTPSQSSPPVGRHLAASRPFCVRNETFVWKMKDVSGKKNLGKFWGREKNIWGEEQKK